MSKPIEWIALVTLGSLALASVAEAKDCSWSRFQTDLEETSFAEGAGPVTLAVDGRKVSIEGICPEKKSRVRLRRRGMSVKARWKRCGALARGVRVRFRTTPDCESGSGIIRVKIPRLDVRFEATRISGCSALVKCEPGTVPADTTGDGCSDRCEPDPQRCEQAVDCGSKGMFCARPAGGCGEPGRCEPVSNALCLAVWDPVCGCDGVTYSNACDARSRGASVAHAGECRRQCAGIRGLGCEKGEVCELAAGQCGVSDIHGVCVEHRPVCPEIFRPVCGCDGRTYGNDCERIAAFAAKDHEGACRLSR